MSSEPSNALSEYVVNIGGLDHTLLLDQETADRYGDNAVKAKREPAPKNKSRTSDVKTKG